MENTVEKCPKPQKIRYALLDELRGFMVLCMVFYHWFLSVYMMFGFDFADKLFVFFTPVEPVFAGGFILLSGMMCGFSRSNLKRGVALALISAAMTGVTLWLSSYVGDVQILFGILHLLSFSMIFCGLFNFILKRINRWVGLLVSLSLFILTYGFDWGGDILGLSNLLPQSIMNSEYLFPFGIIQPGFYSADYFSIIPWFFLFLAGYYLFKFHLIERFEKIFLPSRIKPLAFLGRHALIIYILHQPLIYIICLPFLIG